MKRASPAILAVLGLALASSALGQSQSGDPLDAAVRVPRIAIGSLVLIGEDHPAPDLADFPATVSGDTATVAALWVERWWEVAPGTFWLWKSTPFAPPAFGLIELAPTAAWFGLLALGIDQFYRRLPPM
ncbi:MAG: hypothetical protein ACHQ2Z_13470, partial [Elusimicrobiota bacterium]